MSVVLYTFFSFHDKFLGNKSTLRFGLLLFALKNVAERFKTKSMRFCFQLRTYSVVNIQKD